MGFVLLLIPFVFAIVWVYQFVQLMLLEDTMFPSRYDKPLWVAAFILVLPLAPLAFIAWKSARTSEKSAKSVERAT